MGFLAGLANLVGEFAGVIARLGLSFLVMVPILLLLLNYALVNVAEANLPPTFGYLFFLFRLDAALSFILGGYSAAYLHRTLRSLL